MTTTIQITKVGPDSYAFGATIFNVAGGLGYISFSCNDESFFAYFGGGVVFTKFDLPDADDKLRRIPAGATTALMFWDADGIQHFQPIVPETMVNIINANPQAIAKAIHQKITGQEYPGGDVTVIFPNNQIFFK